MAKKWDCMSIVFCDLLIIFDKAERLNLPTKTDVIPLQIILDFGICAMIQTTFC